MFVPPFLMLSDLARQTDGQSNCRADSHTDLPAAVSAQPLCVGLVLRDYAHPARAELAAHMAALCCRQGRYFSIAGDARLAAQFDAGFHCPSFMLARPRLRHAPQRAHVRADTAAVHNMAELIAAKRAGFGGVLISPVFATASHASAQPLGVARAVPLLRAAQAMGMRAYALGGMNGQSWHRLGGFAVADGFAAIDAFAR
jgi:thiamine-phosphate pyrophosphorylase